MHVIQIFLPVRDNTSKTFPKEQYARIREVLTKKFGSVSAYTRTPIEQLWKDEATDVLHEHIVIFEVLDMQLDERWWWGYKHQLETTLSR